MPTCPVFGNPVYYASVFPGKEEAANGINLVWLHGAGGNHLVWPAELRRLPATAVYTPDLPAHGRSAGSGYDTIEAYADWVAAFLEALALRRVVLGGHSMGGAIAQMLAIRQHPALAGLVLIGTGARLRVSPLILEQVRQDFAQVADGLNNLYWSAIASEKVVALSRAQLAASDPQVIYDDFRACDGFDVREKLGQIRLPTLIISAQGDSLTPEKYGRFLAEHIPTSQLLILPEGGHMVMVEQAAAVAAALRQFIQLHWPA
jgi:pimeloyl-ACP methyl ester carboxylesterase